MCEPTHSITQFPDQDPDSGMPTGQVLGLESKPLGFLKRILRWFHFSKLGRGHHEGLASSPLGDKKLEIIGFAQYEALWWKRKVQRDGFPSKSGTDLASVEAFDCAKEYANRVSIGSLQSLRQFLEGSLKTTDRVSMYVEAFREMLNIKGTLVFEDKLKLAGINVSGYYNPQNEIQKTPVTRIITGLTRQRKLLIPEWADDEKLWKGGQNDKV